MSEERVKELQEFVDVFTYKLKEAYHIYKTKPKKQKKMKKSLSQIEYRKTDEEKFPSLLNNNDKPGIISNKILSNKILSLKKLIIRNPIKPPEDWKPQRMISTYFEGLKRLENTKQLNSWERVRKYNYY